MKNRLYLFSDSIIRRKEKTLMLEKVMKSDDIKDEDDVQIEELRREEYLLSDDDIMPTGESKYIPVESIEAVYSFGSLRFNSRFISFLSQHHIPLHIFNYYGGYSGSFYPAGHEVSGSVLISQVLIFRNKLLRLKIGKEFAAGSMSNSIANLRYYQNRGGNLTDAIAGIEEFREAVLKAESVSEIMGYEGMAKRLYYSSWKEIFVYPADFTARVKHPPDNLINALISYGNAIVYSVCLDEIYLTRLYPEIGFLHEPADGKLSLSYDIAEIFKPLITDRVIFKVINKNMISEGDALIKNSICTLKKSTKETFVTEIEAKLNTLIEIPGREKRMSYRRLIREECYNLLKLITENREYKAYISKW